MFVVFSSPHIVCHFHLIICILMLISSIKIFMSQLVCVFLWNFFSQFQSFQSEGGMVFSGPENHQKNLHCSDMLCLVFFMSAIPATLKMSTHIRYNWIKFLFCLVPWWHCHGGKNVSHLVMNFFFIFNSSTLTSADTRRSFAYSVGVAEYMICHMPVLHKCVNSPEVRNH